LYTSIIGPTELAKEKTERAIILKKMFIKEADIVYLTHLLSNNYTTQDLKDFLRNNLGKLANSKTTRSKLRESFGEIADFNATLYDSSKRQLAEEWMANIFYFSQSKMLPLGLYLPHFGSLLPGKNIQESNSISAHKHEIPM
jgi:hypothetical protein